MNEVYEFIKAEGTYYLATVEGDQPRVRPFGTIDLFEDKLYIQTGKVKAVSRQIEANPKVELCAFKDGKWLRVSGELVRDERVEAKAHMLDNYPELKAMYSATDDNTEVLYLRMQRLYSLRLPKLRRRLISDQDVILDSCMTA